MKRRQAPPGVWIVLGASAVFAGPALFDFLKNLWVLLGIRAPHLDWPQMVFCDALLAYRGDPLYANPALGPTSVTYNPGFPYLIGALLHVKAWTGWGLLVNQLAVLGLAALTGTSAAAAVKTPLRPWLRGLLALALGALSLRLMTQLSAHAHLLYQARADHLAWLLAGLGFASLWTRQRWRVRCWSSALLLALGFWTKQTTAAWSVAAALAWLLLGDGPRPRRFLQWSSLGAAIHLLTWGVLHVTTHGWYTELIWIRPLSALSQVTEFSTHLRGLLVRSGGVLGATLFAASLAWGAQARASRNAKPGLLQALLLTLPLGAAAACQFSRGQGADLNQFIGLGWLVGWLASVSIAHLLDGIWVPLALALAAGFSWTAPMGVKLKPTDLPPSQYYDEAHTLAELAPSPLFHYHYCGSNRPGEPVIPNANNLVSLKAADWVPMSLIDQFLDGGFRATTTFQIQTPFWDSYASHGTLDEGFFSRLDALILRRYESRPGGGLLLPKSPFPTDAWERTCFMPPLHAPDGTLFAQRQGLGFWCAATPDASRAFFRPLPKADREYSEICSPPLRNLVGAELTFRALPGEAASFAIRLRQGARNWVYARVADPTEKPGELFSWFGPGNEVRSLVLRPAHEAEVRVRITGATATGIQLEDSADATPVRFTLDEPGPGAPTTRFCVAGVRQQPMELRLEQWKALPPASGAR